MWRLRLITGTLTGPGSLHVWISFYPNTLLLLTLEGRFEPQGIKHLAQVT